MLAVLARSVLQGMNCLPLVLVQVLDAAARWQQHKTNGELEKSTSVPRSVLHTSPTTSVARHAQASARGSSTRCCRHCCWRMQRAPCWVSSRSVLLWAQRCAWRRFGLRSSFGSAESRTRAARSQGERGWESSAAAGTWLVVLRSGLKGRPQCWQTVWLAQLSLVWVKVLRLAGVQVTVLGLVKGQRRVLKHQLESMMMVMVLASLAASSP